MNRIINCARQYKTKNWMEYVLVLLVLVFASVFFAYQTNLLVCGCYFADDHEIVRLNATIHELGLAGTMRLWMSADLHLRFRPVYWFCRVMESFFLRNHVILWHLVKALEVAFCSFLMYVFARKMKLQVYAAFLFSVMSFLGTQCAVIFRLGPQEPLALIWLFGALLFAIRCHEHAGKGNRIGFLLCLTLMMGTKESFLVLVPVIILFLCYLEWRKCERFSIREYAQAFVKYRGILIYTVAVFLLCMGVIVFYCGVDSTGYAGFDSSFSVSAYLNAIREIWLGSLSLYLKLFICAMLLCAGFCGYHLLRNKEQRANQIFLRLCELALPVYFILSQSVIHAKSGMDERYLLPCVTGILIYVVVLSYEYFVALKWTRILYYVGISAVFLLLAINSHIWSTTQNYATVCIHNMQMLDRVNQLTERYDGADTNIIISTQYGEWNLAFSAFMQELYGAGNVYALSQTDATDTLARDRYLREGEADRSIEITDADIYVVQNEYLPIKLQEKGVYLSDYSYEIFGYYIVYYKE